MPQIANLTGISVPVTTDHPVPHGLVRTPDIVLLLHGTGANVTKGAAADATNVYLDNGGGGPENAEVLAMAVHSIADGGNQIVLLTGTVAVGVDETVAHGLVRAPSIVVLGFGSGANVSVGSAPNATNIFLTNGGGGPEAYEALVMAPHSIIA